MNDSLYQYNFSQEKLCKFESFDQLVDSAVLDAKDWLQKYEKMRELISGLSVRYLKIRISTTEDYELIMKQFANDTVFNDRVFFSPKPQSLPSQITLLIYGAIPTSVQNFLDLSL